MLCLWALLLPSHALAFGKYLTDGRTRWELVRTLGSGSFGEVWEVAQADYESNRYAVKLFKDLEYGERALSHYTRIYEFFQENGSAPNLLNVSKPEIMDLKNFYGRRLSKTPVIMFDMVDGSLQAFRADFQLNMDDYPREVATKLRRMASLKNDIINAISFLYLHGVSHYDINPRNILIDGNRFLLGDYDSMAPLSSKPMNVPGVFLCAHRVG